MKYKMKIWYTASPDDKPQIHVGLEGKRLEDAANAFLRDLLAPEGQGVRRIMIEKESAETQAFKEVAQAGESIKTIREAAQRQGVDIR